LGFCCDKTAVPLKPEGQVRLLDEQKLLVHHPSLTQRNGLLLGESAASQKSKSNALFK
jgi:hypothetical protein